MSDPTVWVVVSEPYHETGQVEGVFSELSRALDFMAFNPDAEGLFEATVDGEVRYLIGDSSTATFVSLADFQGRP